MKIASLVDKNPLVSSELGHRFMEFLFDKVSNQDGKKP
jgi:hypothetical protein